MLHKSNVNIGVGAGASREYLKWVEKTVDHSRIYGHHARVFELKTGRIKAACVARGCRWPEGKRYPYPILKK